MPTAQTNRVRTYLHRIAFLQERGGATDAQLLDRFLARREEIAFEELVRRHGPMVLGVCRRVLGDPHDAADAFQATFLVLIRQADSVVPRSRVGPWLYGVARRTALKARSSAARRRRAEQDAIRGRPDTTPPTDAGGDLRPLLDEELGLLPDKYRDPLVLCLLQGKSRKEAAGLLGWSEGTLSGRLARAKALLGARLQRRGVALAGVALLAAITQSAAAAEVPALLVATTVNAAAALAGPAAANAVSIPVIALTEKVMKAMLISKLKAIGGVLVLVAAIGLGAGMVGWHYGPTVWAAAPAGAGGDGKSVAASESKAQAKPRADVIESPDVLRVEYAPADDAGPVKIAGQYLVRPDGTIGLGPLGSVAVSGRTPVEAHRAIAEHLARRLDGFDPRKLAVAVVAQNSKFFYVITEGAAGGEDVYRFPATGNESVLDALCGAKVKLIGLGQKRIYVRRISDDAKSGQVLPVDWDAITKRGETATNYLLVSGDRLFIESPAPKQTEDAPRTGAVKGAGADSVRELEAVVKAFRAARSHEEQRRLVEDLDAVLKKVREQLKRAEGASYP
jgi:RNA polymerase sigma factor (sigma-70 family)